MATHPWVRVALGAVFSLLISSTAVAADRTEQAKIERRGGLAAVLSDADEAMEYWDVTAWFDSGERVFARFLVTNQGPGKRTAAAVGHVLVGGEVLPFQWGRRESAWAFSADGRRLEIGKATLDLSGQHSTLRVKSTKRGIDLSLAIERDHGESTSLNEIESISTSLRPPAPARAELAGRTLSGWAAVTHTWMDQPESDLIRRRDELFARDGDTALYVSTLTATDGQRHESFSFSRTGSGSGGGGSTAGDFTGASISGDPAYPVRSTWTGSIPGAKYEATLERERLRMNPLDILPQPFRFLLSLGGRPQRVWADARVTVTRDAKEPIELRGVTASAFARPVER